MRTIPSSLDSNFKKLVQAESTKAAPAVDLWISRPVVPLVNDYFLEQQAIGNGSNVTALDIAVAHPRHRRQSTKIYIATVENGRAKVVSSPFRQAMETHVWTDSGFSERAEDVALAFDATMKNDTRGRSEFVTDELPWVFWVNSGALYGQQLGSNEILTLAEANCTKCTAIRAAGSALGGFDYGLCLFFLLNGAIYVRQYIDGEWMDAEPVNFGPGVTFADISASRSWDYRVILQAMAADGTVYELFTQYMGVGQRSVEHIEVKGMDASSNLTKIGETDMATTEHIEMVGINAGALYGGLYSSDLPSFRSARNVPVEATDDEGAAYEDWGKVVLVDLAVHLEPVSVANNAAQFVLTDGKGKSFVAASAEPINANGLTLKLTFADFNMASGSCTISYTPGTVHTMYGLTAEAMSVQFTPENLVAPSVPEPKAVEAWAVDESGTQIAIRFNQEIVSELTTDGWSVSMPEYDKVPGGALSIVSRTVISVSFGDDMAIVLLGFAAGNQNSVQNAAGPITVSYNGTTLAGDGGFVQAFELECPIDGLAYKGGQNDEEHITISSIQAVGKLSKLSRSNYYAPAEHITIGNMTATGVLTHLNDI